MRHRTVFLRLVTTLLAIAVPAIAIVFAPSAKQDSPAGNPQMMRGVNLASGEFGTRSLPGRYGHDYVYPDGGVAEPFIRAGMDTVRLPILWERIQPEPFGDLSEVEMTRIDAMIAAMNGFQTILIDVHNYGRYHRDPLTAGAGGAKLADLWNRLARRYADDQRVAFGIMNEPHGIDARVWRAIVDETVQSIRNTGATNLLLIPGTAWTGGHSWTKGGAGSNGAAFAGFEDPADNFFFEMHQYLDADSSGTSDQCVSPAIARSRLEAATRWLREEGQRAVLAEIGAPANASCLEALEAVIRFVETEHLAWAGWIYWAGGAWWGDYSMSVQPLEGRQRPQMTVLRNHLPAGGASAN